MADALFATRAIAFRDKPDKLSRLHRLNEARCDFQAWLVRRAAFGSDIQQAMICIYLVGTAGRGIDEDTTVPCSDPMVPGLSCFSSLLPPIDAVLALRALGTQVPSIKLLCY